MRRAASAERPVRPRGAPPPLLALLLLAFGCSRGAPPRETPAGVVLRLSGVDIRAEEVDRLADRLSEIEPFFAQSHRRRIALTQLLFPLLTARAIAGEGREEARAQAEEFRRSRVEGAQGPLAAPLEGDWRALGLGIWLEVSKLEPGRWSEVFEVPGAFVVARLLERGGEGAFGPHSLRADLLQFPYLASRQEIDERVFDQQLEIVDPSWEKLVPMAWQYRMRGGS